MSQVGWTQNDTFDNWDDVSTEAPKLLDPGFYCATIAKATGDKPTSKSNKPAVNLELSVTDIFQGDKLPMPRKVFDNVVVTKEAAFRVKALCQSADVAPPKSNGADYLPGWATDLVGCNVIVQIKHETFKTRDGEQKTVARVGKYHTQASAEKALGGGETASAAEASAENGAAPKRARRGAPTAQA